MSTTDPAQDEAAPQFPYQPEADVRPTLTAAKALGITLAVIFAVLGLLALAFLLMVAIAFNSWGSNK